jgi:signal transduction histidine kinase
MWTFKARLRLAIFASTALVSAAAAVVSWTLVRQVVLRGLDGTLRARAEMLGAMCTWDEAEDALRFDWPPGLSFEKLMARTPCELEIWRVHPSQLLYRNGPELPRYGTNELFEPGPKERMSRARFHTLHEPSRPLRRLATVLVKLPLPENVPDDLEGTRGEVMIRLAFGMQPEEEILNDAAWLFAGLAAAAALLLGAVAQMLASRFGRPVLELARATQQARPDLAPAMPRGSSFHEIEVLADALERSFAEHRRALERQARFTSDAAHELRTPLAAMRASADVALRRERTLADYEVFFRHVTEGLDRFEETVSDLIELARLDRLTPQLHTADTVDLQEIITRALADLDEAQAARVVRRGDREPALVTGRPRMLQILVGNLVHNALQYSPLHEPVELELTREKQRFTLRIRDRGEGLAPDELERVFDRFYRAPRSASTVPGSGIGLSISRSIAEFHGGSLRLELAHPGICAIASIPAAYGSATSREA